MKTTIRLALASIALSALTATAGPAQELGLAVGTTAPAAAVETLDGSAANLSTVLGGGKPTVIEFWATWCSNCRELEPAMEAAFTKHKDRVRFVGVAVGVNQSDERVRRYVAEHLSGFTHFYDRRGNAVEAYDVPATSYVVVLDGQGKVVYSGLGGKQDIEGAIAKALR
ncbi:MAG: TlpA family protein disulfide reductase [Gemmatimonadaceae bacterium]|nr:TlpA family protein disulfide reductase [Gemmatimonadaceae bacterium]